MSESPLEIVSARIRDRYSNPARHAYTYLFRLEPGTLSMALVPTPESVMSAWVDEGQGLLPLATPDAVHMCAVAAQIKPHERPPTTLTPHQRKQMMARVITFTVEMPNPDQVDVRLWSRALGFSPKGDRQAHEIWKRAAGDFWYSAYRPDGDEA